MVPLHDRFSLTQSVSMDPCFINFALSEHFHYFSGLTGLIENVEVQLNSFPTCFGDCIAPSCRYVSEMERVMNAGFLTLGTHN